MIRKYILLLLSLVFYIQLYAQKEMNHKYKDQFAKADSLMNRAMPESAAIILEKIINDAKTNNDAPIVIKAQIILLSASAENTENGNIINLQKVEQYIAQSHGVEKAIWQSIAASMYWNFYQNNRWKIYSRTTVESNTSDDIETWDVRKFISKTTALYEASISNEQLLKQTKVENISVLIQEGVNTRELRPTVYDLLANRAITYFQNDEKDVTNPSFKFQIDDQRYFQDAASFSKIKMESKDSISLQLKALQIYQNLIAFHLDDRNPDALIDADMNRLQFINSKAVVANKKDLYIAALERIKNKYPNNQQAALASFYLLQNAYGTKDSTTDISAIAKGLNVIIASFSKSQAAAFSKALLNNIESKNLNITAEKVVLPNEYSKVLIQYKNIDKIFLKLYKVPTDFGNNIRENNYETKLGNQKLVAEWTVDLLGSQDMNSHSTEVKIAPQSLGNYILVASSESGNLFSKENNTAFVEFAISNLSMLNNSASYKDDDIYVVHRKSGEALRNVKIEFYQDVWNSKASQYVKTNVGNGTTTENGYFDLNQLTSRKNGQTYTAIKLISGTDTLYHNLYLYNYTDEASYGDGISTNAFIFTDRGIYRPGQTVYFKAIILDYNEKNNTHKVKSNYSTAAILRDANYEEVKKITLTTNEFGSITGTFIAPETGLTGSMSIEVAGNATPVQVEEYKRPKFFVEFDTLKDSYALNKSVKIKGFAKAYSGINIDGANVKYRVVREARFPYYWRCYYWGFPSSPATEIKNGEATTQADGSFEVEFTTIPDPSVSKETLPIFTYKIYADVTDINGETRSSQQHVNAGYNSLQISVSSPSDVAPDSLKQIQVNTQNLNSVFVPAQVSMNISPLKYPGKLYRSRLWQMPDKMLMSESEFHAAFPDDEYKNEGSYLNWSSMEPVYKTNFTSTKDGIVEIPKSTWKDNGWYVIEVSTKDAQGNEISEKKYIHIWDEKNTQSPIQKELIIKESKSSYEPGDEAKTYVGSAFGKINLVSISSWKEYNVANYKLPIIFSKTITEADRGGISFAWSFVYNNRVYTTTNAINVPWTNKDLHIEWATHRDKLQPGEEDEWTMTISGDKKEKVAAEMLATMYDASLDAFKKNNFDFDRLLTYAPYLSAWQNNFSFGYNNSTTLSYGRSQDYISYEKRYDILNYPDYITEDGVYYSASSSEDVRRAENKAAPAPPVQALSKNTPQFNNAFLEESADGEAQKKGTSQTSDTAGKLQTGTGMPPEHNASNIQIRSNLNETAFFLPFLKTDDNGNIKIKFKVPEALTEWRFMTFAHTKDWKVGTLEGSIKTQKDLMVIPNLPRFFRQGDDMVISAKINSLSDKNLNGTASIEILNAATLQPMNLPFRIQNSEQAFTLAKGQSTTASWHIHVPEFFNPVVVRIIAKAGDFSDGEENTIPIVTNRMLATETLPLPVRGSDEQTFELSKLKNANSSSLVNHALTVEFTGNPAWYAVQALPYLMEYPYECAEQTFSRFYANALAGHIVGQSPKVESIFNKWRTEDTAALISNLSKNTELKSALLEETPWVMEAKNETEQKHRIALLFETHKLSKELQKSWNKLEAMQLPEGGFPWFKGMRSDRYITQYIVTGIARLQHLGVNASLKNGADQILDKAMPYLDRELQKDYDNLIKYKADLNKQQIGFTQIQYLYMRSFYPENAVPKTIQKSFDYYKSQAVKYWPSFSPYMKGMIALALDRLNEKKTAQDIIQSLKETAIENKELGMYWQNMPRGYWWYEAPIEAQALLIETFKEVAQDEKTTEDLKVWLLKQKQTQNWGTTKATADACYALLLSGTDWLSNEPIVTIQLGDTKIIKSSDLKTEAGTGYFKQRIAGADVKPNFGDIKVKVENNNAVSWGAVYWQYFEDLDKITSAATPLSLTKQLFIERNTDRGPVLTEIKDGNELKVGDKVISRIVLKVDRDMEYIHLKDMRGACFEPTNVLSTYKYQGGLGYYESTKDVSTNFFFDRINKGTYVFEYPMFVQQKGDFSNGIASIQCMYAPEFSSHSEGIRVIVK